MEASPETRIESRINAKTQTPEAKQDNSLHNFEHMSRTHVTNT